MNILKCEVCEKEFIDRGQKYKPQYQLNEHRKTCFNKFKKKQKAFIKNWVANIGTDIEINRVYQFIKNPDSFFQKLESEPRNMKDDFKEPISNPSSPEPEIDEELEFNNDEVEYEKEYFSDHSDSNSESEYEYEDDEESRPATPDLIIWNDIDNNMKYYVDNEENVYMFSNKALLGKRRPIKVKKNDTIYDTFKIDFI